MIRNKFIIFPFLLFAWTIIFAHNIVPHHHHSENLVSECNLGHSHGGEFLDITEIHDCDHESNDHTCHFHVDVLTKVSLDNVFDTNADNVFLYNLNCSESHNNIFVVDFISDQIPKTDHLRGPPHKA